MAAANAPITMKKVLTLPSIGINQQFITFTNVTMESDKYICVRETAPQKSVVIIDMNMPMQPLRRPITADSALMNPNSRILALKAQVPGTTQDHLQIFNIEAKAKLKSHQMPEQVAFWKWITPKMLGLVTETSVYHWSIEGDSEPVKMFDRTANLANNQIMNYKCSPNDKWLVLIGIAPGSSEQPQLVKGNMQLFSVDQQRSQALEAHAASFAQFKVPGNENPSILISFASKSFNAGQITSKLHVMELGAQPGKPSFTKKQADLFFPPDFADDFPVAVQVNHKFNLIYVITKLGLLFVYDLETASAIYRNRISPDPIFLTSEASSVGGFYAINRRGQVLLATVNEATIIPFISGQLNNLELAVNLARRGNLPGAENLVVQRFQELFAQTKYKEAAELAAESPQGILRTPDTVAKFQSVPVQAGQTPPLLQYFGTLLTRGKLNAYESLELSRLVVNQNKKNLLENWLAEDKLECSEELGDLVKTVDNDLALKIYIKARATPKVIAAFGERREFDKILIYSKQSRSVACQSVACLWSRAPPSHRVTATAALTNPPTLYTGGSDGSIIWWSISSPESDSEVKAIAMLCGHTAPIVDLAVCDPTTVSANGVIADCSDSGNADPFVNCCAMISACTDGVLCVWSRSSGHCRRRRKLPPWVGSPSILCTLPSEPRYVCVGCSYVDTHSLDTVDGAETLADTDFQNRNPSRCTVVVVDTYTLTIVHTVFHGNLSIGHLNFMGVVQLEEQESLLMADSSGRLQLVSVSENSEKSEDVSESSKGSFVSRNWLNEGEIAISVITRGNLVAFFSKNRCVFGLLNRWEAIGEISIADNLLYCENHSSNFRFKEAMLLYSSTSTIEVDKDDRISETFVLWGDSGSAVLFDMSYIDGEFAYKNLGETITASDKHSEKSAFCFVQLRQYLLRVESSCCDIEQPLQRRPHITVWSLCLGNGNEKEFQCKLLGEGSYFADWTSSSCLDLKGSVSAETGNSHLGSQCSIENDLQSFVSDNGQCVSSSMVISENMYVPYAVVYGFFSGDIEIAKFDYLHGLDSPASSLRSVTDSLVSRQHLLGHTGSVLCLAAHRMFGDANGCSFSHVLISGSMDCTIRIWDLESGNVVMIMHHHNAPVRQIILAPARTERPWSNCFLSVGDDSCVALSSLETLRVERMFPGHPNYPTKVVWDGTRGYIACLFRSLSRKSYPIDVLYIWDVKTGVRERILRGAASHSMFDHFCAGISEKSHSGTVLNENTSVSSLLFPVDEERKQFYLKNYERAASLSTSKPSASQAKTREEGSITSSFLESIRYPPIKCTCPFPGISALIFDLSSLAVSCQSHENSDMHKMLEESCDKPTAQQKTSNDKSSAQKTLDYPAEVVHMDKAIGEYLIRFSLSFLHLWGIDSELDQMLVAHLKLKRPESFIVTSGLQGDKGSLTLAFPGLNATLELWKSSSEFSALRSVMMVSLAQCMISLSHSTATCSSNLAAFYTRNLLEKYPDLKPPLLQLLVTFWQDKTEQVRMAARSLFHHTASLAIPLPLCSDHASEHAKLVRSLSGFSLNESKVLSTEEEHPTNRLDSDHIHQAQRLSQAEESELLSWLESFEMQDWISCVGGTSQDAMAAHIIVAAALSIWYPSLVKPGLAMLVVYKLLNLVMAMSEKYSSTAAELLSEGMETTWKTWIGPDIPRIVSDIFFQIECVSSSAGAHQTVSSSIKETLVEVLLPSLAMADVPGFLSIIESQIWSTASDSPVHVVSLRTLIRIIRAAPRNLVMHLEKVVNFVLQTMDPSNTVMRKTCLQTSMATMREVVRVFPMVILNNSSTRLAIGDAIAEINNACIRIYDMQSMTKIRILDASGPPGLPNLLRGASESAVTTAISALSFSPDGEGLAAFSENGLMIRWWSLGSGWWEKLSRTLTPVQCTKLIFIPPWDGFSSNSSRTSVISSITSDEQELPLQETSKNISHAERLKQLVHHLDLSYRLKWASERKVVLTRHSVELGTCLL